MVVLGYDSTVPVTLADIERCAGAVVRGSDRAHVVADLPFGSYEAADADAVAAALVLVKRAGVSSVKLEGGVRSAARIRAIVAAGIPVMGHIGVLPQTAALTTGFGRRKRRDTLLADARAVEEAGAYAVVLEMIDAEIAGEITAALRIPTIGIGSGGACDGQVLVLHDLLGLYPDSPPFAKRYADLGAAATAALRTYAQEVRSGTSTESSG
jgi:3-methyl-2-oxobutanoate hydroxymethyltransferase